MATRIKDDAIPYKWGIGIEITDNHIINVLLREANNLIHVNENNELYVDLQLDEWIAPDDDFPVWVTTGKILQSDGWQQSWLILNRKTTSGDYARLIYANDGNLYVDLWDGVWRLIGSGTPGESCNTRTFYLPSNVIDVSNPDLTEIQNAMDWYFDGKNAILWLDEINGGQMYVFYEDHTDVYDSIQYRSVKWVTISWENRWTANYAWSMMRIEFIPWTHTVQRVIIDSRIQNDDGSFIPTDVSLREWFYPTALSHPISLGYLDQELAKKQDVLTAGTRITIQPDPNTGNLVISADVSGVMTYKGNVTDPTQLPSTGQQIWDCWYSISDWHLYAWDGTQWNDIGGTGIDLTNYFNKTTDTSDNITQWTTNLFVTQQEKNTWNGKQDQLIAGQNITIDPDTNVISAKDTTYTAWDGIVINGNNVISNDAPFDPDNAWAMGQVLTKTSNWYEWKNPATSPYTAWRWINIDQNEEISNTWVLTVNSIQPDANGNVNVDEFEPENAGSIGQVLKKTATGYEWANESGGGGIYTPGHGINIDQNNEISNTLPFDPDNAGITGNVLKKTNQGYEWDSIKEFDPSNQGQNNWVLKTDWNGDYYWAPESWWWGGTYYAGDGIDIDSNNVISNEWVLTVNNQHPDASGNINVSGTNYTAWSWIRINSNDEIINDAPFDPDNIGSAWQVLKKTQNWYEWQNESGWGNTYYAGTGISISSSNYISNDWVLTINGNSPDQNGNINVSWTNYTAWTWISIDSSDVISNSQPFDPDNNWSSGQVLKKTNNWYEWSNSNEVPGWGTVWQVLTKNQNWYGWSNVASGSDVDLFVVNSSTSTTPDLIVAQSALDWYNAGKLPIIKAYKSDRWDSQISADRFFIPDKIEHFTDPQTGTSYDVLECYAIYNENDFSEDVTHWYTILRRPLVQIKIESWSVTQVTIGSIRSSLEDFLSTNMNYTNPYIPIYAGSPATKQYVDDRNRVGTQAQYNALTTIDPTVIYNITL